MATDLVTRNACAFHLAHDEVLDIERRYGSGQRAGYIWLLYHNSDHTRLGLGRALVTAWMLVEQGRINARDVPLIHIAYAFHDHELLLGSGENEEASADAASAAMAEYPEIFSSVDMVTVRRLIMGTVVSFDAVGNVTQAARAEDLLEAVVADADLSSVGYAEGPYVALMLFLERESEAGRLQLPRSAAELDTLTVKEETLTTFFIRQKRLFADHRFMVDMNERMWGPQRGQNLLFLDVLTQVVERGETIAQLLAAARSHAADSARIEDYRPLLRW